MILFLQEIGFHFDHNIVFVKGRKDLGVNRVYAYSRDLIWLWVEIKNIRDVKLNLVREITVLEQICILEMIRWLHVSEFPLEIEFLLTVGTRFLLI